MNTTINISLPSQMYKDAKEVVITQRYTSISELIRDALRKNLYSNITVNGFTQEFENEILKSEKEPWENDFELKGDKEIKDYFLHLKLPEKYRKKSLQ